MGRDFGNEADMSVDEKLHPSLGPTEEAQDVATLPRIVVPVPAYNDPNNPVAAQGSVNMSLNDHPLEHSEDYGETAVAETGEDGVAFSLQGEGAPEDRSEWKKADYQKALKARDLPTSGNLAELEARLKEAEEAGSADAEDDRWQREVRNSSRADLDKMAGDYGLDPAEFSNREDLAEAIIVKENEEV